MGSYQDEQWNFVFWSNKRKSLRTRGRIEYIQVTDHDILEFVISKVEIGELPMKKF